MPQTGSTAIDSVVAFSVSCFVLGCIVITFLFASNAYFGYVYECCVFVDVKKTC